MIVSLSTAMMILSAVMRRMCADGVILEPLHLRALVDLHAIVDQQVLETLERRQRIDSVGAAVANAGGVVLCAENALQLAFVVDPLVGESDALAALALFFDGVAAVLAEPEEQRILFKQTALDVVLLDRRNEAFDAGKRRGPDFARCLGA